MTRRIRTTPLVLKILFICAVLLIMPFMPAASAEDGQLPVVGKNPGGETVCEGYAAEFISYADYTESCRWLLVNADGSETYTLQEAAEKFPGLSYDGDGTADLFLYDIPFSMNFYRILCQFTNTNGTVSSEPALILVEKENSGAEEPSITGQPVGGTLDVGTEIHLNITATVAEGTVHYQWYRSAAGVWEDGVPIPDTDVSYYQPEQTVGISTYFAAVWNECSGMSSTVQYSDLVQVEYVGTLDANQFKLPDEQIAGTRSTAGFARGGSAILQQESTEPVLAPGPDEGDSFIIYMGLLICFGILVVCSLIIILKNGGFNRQSAKKVVVEDEKQ